MSDVAVQWATPWRRVVAFTAAGVALVVLSATTDRAGLLLGAAGAALLIGLAVRDAGLRPTLAADDAGLIVAEGLRRLRVPWPDVVAVRATDTSRRLLVLRSIEVDLGERLLVVAEGRLGAPAREVAAELERLRRGVSR